MKPPAPDSTLLDPNKLSEADVAIRAAIDQKLLPGAVIWVERRSESYHKAYGSKAVLPTQESMQENTIFDVASLTKVVATAPSILLLIERGKLELDAPVHRYIAGFTNHAKEKITVRHLLTHTSGLRAGLGANPPWQGADHAIQLACAEKTGTPPGTAFLYSDINYVLLGELVRRASGKPLNEFAEQEIFRPLKMSETHFRPTDSARKMDLQRFAPTEPAGSNMLRGVVHDPTARRMGGVSGNAGLFSTAADLARFCRTLLNRGELDGVRVLAPATVELMTRVQTPDSVSARRGLGWDIDSGYSRPRGKFPLGSYGHTGWTGTSIWIDPFSQSFWVFLSNRNHPDGKGNVLGLQSALAGLVSDSIRGFNMTNVVGALPPRKPGSAMALNGIDVLKRDQFRPLRKMKVGLVTNHTGRDRDGNSTIDLLFKAPDVELKALFSPEHGIRGELDEKVGDSKDEKTGLPVYSLYGVRRVPIPEQLEGLDALVFDIQDIGCRFYTYISTMGNCMEAAAKQRIRFFVLDRVNPINATGVEGPIHLGKSIFTAYHPIPLRHGMTVGELAQMFNAEKKFGADLVVVPVEGWSREMFFDQTGLKWVNPSPNMRSLPAAILYPGLGLHETALSVGRGTDTPFELIGAPYIKGNDLVAELKKAKLAGVNFTAEDFTPSASTFKGQQCGGVRFAITDRKELRPVDLGIELALALQRLYPEQFALTKVQTLLQETNTLSAIREGKPLGEITNSWQSGLSDFKIRRERYLIYR